MKQSTRQKLSTQSKLFIIIGIVALVAVVFGAIVGFAIWKTPKESDFVGSWTREKTYPYYADHTIVFFADGTSTEVFNGNQKTGTWHFDKNEKYAVVYIEQSFAEKKVYRYDKTKNQLSHTVIVSSSSDINTIVYVYHKDK